ncbi:MAG: trypsin-like peptidase domain-containing protein [Candidatus Eremiobacteraeota bacterium]|nr:trypsin-like peptidase domain-containing protein [Candidatus Eremiobacteraeota bacterium]MBC5828159.1 trypsin-like peptidase domain-containing protein [Candidatus Eremiobacteraeota bacterium]
MAISKIEPPEDVNSLVRFSDSLAAAVEVGAHCVVCVKARRRFPSSGVHWRAGVIVTADHTIERDDDVSVVLPDGRSVAASIAGRDSTTDVAALRLDAVQLPTADFAEAAALRPGHLTLAIARSGQGSVSTSLGVMSAIGEAWTAWGGGQIDRLLRPDLDLYPGFSGGPLVDAGGRVIGINTSGLSRRIDVTIPAATVDRVLDQLLAHGRISRGYIGVGVQEVRIPERLQSGLRLANEDALIVLSLEAGGPAESAGLMIGDVIVAVDGSALEDTDDLQRFLTHRHVGKAIALRIVRGGELVDKQVVVAQRPEAED